MPIIRPIVRPVILLLILFGVLFVLRDPLRNLDENASSLRHAYIDPIIEMVRGNASTTPGAFALPWFLNSPFSIVPIQIFPGIGDIRGATSSASTSIPGVATTSKKALPTTSTPNKTVLIPKDQTIKADDSTLSIGGILAKTNAERIKKNLPSLKLNVNLNGSAGKKLEDMFTNQYFEHQSPTGVNVSDLVRKEQYTYIVVGENLALGNFGGDVQVVTAWMNSPGHRANILDSRFQEIGISVGRGMYKGREQWIAVQHFAKPLSSCPSPNNVLKSQIDIHTADLSARERELAVLKKEIDESTDMYGDAYKEKVEQYNTKVSDYNSRLESLKDEIARYNEQVRSFNSCAGLVSSTKKVAESPAS